MYEFHRIFTDDLHRERLQEADRSRLARQVPRSQRPTLAVRVRGLMGGLFGQPAPAPALSGDPAACNS
jgi:hypothetical protein